MTQHVQRTLIIIASAGTISTQDFKPNVWLRFDALFQSELISQLYLQPEKHFIACFIKESWTTLQIVTGLDFIKWDHDIIDLFNHFRIFLFLVILLLLPRKFAPGITAKTHCLVKNFKHTTAVLQVIEQFIYFLFFLG